MDGIIKNFRRGKRNVNEKQIIIEAKGIDSKAKAYALVGSRVVWTNVQGTSISGKISSAHGGNGAMRALCAKGMPGQSLGDKIEIFEKKKTVKAEKKSAVKPEAEKKATAKPKAEKK